VVPALKVDGKFIPNPLVETGRWLDESGQIVYGTPKSGEARTKGKELLAAGEIDLSLLDEMVENYITRLLYTFPNCTVKTVNSLRQKKLEYWDKNKEANREWLMLNMMTEAKAGFQAFNDGPKGHREVDFVKLRQLLAEGREWNDEMMRVISPQYLGE